MLPLLGWCTFCVIIIYKSGDTIFHFTITIFYSLALNGHEGICIDFIVMFCRSILLCFITDITLIILWQLIQTPDTTVLGLVFLQTASEELVCPWEDLSVSRKEELRRLFLAHIPQVFTILTGIDFIDIQDDTNACIWLYHFNKISEISIASSVSQS